MPAFENSPESWQRTDWPLLQNGFVTLFWAQTLFTATKSQLREDGYQLFELDTSAWNSTDTALLSLATALSFPDYFGRNLNALVDCLRDVATFDYGSDADSTGTVIALDNFDEFARHTDMNLAWTLLDVFAATARLAILIGHRASCLFGQTIRKSALTPLVRRRLGGIGTSSLSPVEFPKSALTRDRTRPGSLRRADDGPRAAAATLGRGL